MLNVASTFTPQEQQKLTEFHERYAAALDHADFTAREAKRLRFLKWLKLADRLPS